MALEGQIDIGEIGGSADEQGNVKKYNQFHVVPVAEIPTVPPGGYYGALLKAATVSELQTRLAAALEVEASSIALAYNGKDLDIGLTFKENSVLEPGPTARREGVKAELVFALPADMLPGAALRELEGKNATVRWCAQDVVLRTVHLDNLPVQLLNRDGHPQVSFFENVTAGQRNSPAGYIPNGTGATVNNANLDGNYTLALVNLPMGPRTVRTMDLQGLPLRNFQTPAGAAAPAAPVNQVGHYQYQLQPPMPARVTPQPTAPPMPAQVAPQPTAPPMPAQVAPAQQADLSLNSDVFVRHVEGKPLVAFYFDKNEARLLGPEDGTIPSDSMAQLLELDAPNRGAGGHCKIKWKQNGIPLDVYVRRAHLFSAQLVQMAQHHMPYPAHARPVRIKHTDSNKPDVVFHYTLEAAQRRDQPHGKIPNDEVALMTEQVPQGKGWVMIWYNYQNVFVRQWHIQQPFKTR